MVFRAKEDPLAALRGLELEECLKDGVLSIPLTKGYTAVVDEADADLVLDQLWHARFNPRDKTIYAATGARSRRRKMHHVIVGASCGQIVDHRNHDTLDNRRGNLRKCNFQQNSANKKIPDHRIGLRGLWQRKNGKFTVAICVNYKKLCLGTFETAELAAAAYDRAAEEHFGEFAVTNRNSSNLLVQP